MKILVSFFVFIISANTVFAENIKSLVLHYDEYEEATGAQSVRYLINDRFLRIDNGDDKQDYILFDVTKKSIYSINHDDRTILKIENQKWQQPEFKFKVSNSEELLKGAPKIQSKPVFDYKIKAGEEVCTQVFLIKDVYPAAMSVLYDYQYVMSGQLVATLKNTPVEYQTPCFLVDQVYHSGEYYKSGLPVQITYSRGYSKMLKEYKEVEFSVELFELPEGYSEYGAAQ